MEILQGRDFTGKVVVVTGANSGIGRPKLTIVIFISTVMKPAYLLTVMKCFVVIVSFRNVLTAFSAVVLWPLLKPHCSHVRGAGSPTTSSPRAGHSAKDGGCLVWKD